VDGVTSYLELRVGGDAVVLRLEPERVAKGALARGAGFALSHLDLDPAPSIREGLSRLAHAFEERAKGASGDVAARDALGRAVSETLGGASLRTKRRVDVAQHVPRWPLRMRSGAPDLARGHMWPFDAETTAMRLGLRRLVLREWLDEADADADARWLEENGLVVVRVRDRPESGPIAIFGAHEASIFARAREALAAACTPDAAWRDGARWMGDALGYPKCCVESFVRARMRDDLAMFADLLPPIDATTSPRVGWLLGATTLISHAPCAPTCEASYAIASRTLEEIDRRHAGFAVAWERLAKRVHAIDARGRCFAFDVDGSFMTGTGVTSAVELVPPRDDDRSMAHVVIDDTSWRGCTLSIEDVQLVVRDDDGGERLRAGLACDQRG
jgi:hypothetical protein